MQYSLKERSQQSGLHGREHINKTRKRALWMIWTGMARVVLWSLVLLAFLVGLVWHPFHFAVALFALVAFTAAISDISLIETAWGQVAASKAELVAADAHKDTEHTRERLGIDFSMLESDISQLAELQPGPEAWTLAADIRERLHNQGA